MIIQLENDKISYTFIYTNVYNVTDIFFVMLALEEKLYPSRSGLPVSALVTALKL
jgi:hypothetical protein